MKKPLLLSVIACVLILVLTLTGLYSFGTLKIINANASMQSLADYKETLTSFLEQRADSYTFTEKNGVLECEFFTEGHRYEVMLLDSELGYYTYSIEEHTDAKKLRELYAGIDYTLLSDLTAAIGQNRFSKRDIRAVVTMPLHYWHAPEKEIRQQYIRFKTKQYDETTLIHFSVEKKTEKTFYVSTVTLADRAK